MYIGAVGYAGKAVLVPRNLNCHYDVFVGGNRVIASCLWLLVDVRVDGRGGSLDRVALTAAVYQGYGTCIAALCGSISPGVLGIYGAVVG